LQYLQEQLAVGIMPKNISTFFYDLPNVPPRRSKLVVPNAKHKLRILNVMQLFEMDPETLEGKLATEFIYSGA
jgi:UDP-glucose:glycoprotein glucosyltransferase